MANSLLTIIQVLLHSVTTFKNSISGHIVHHSNTLPACDADADIKLRLCNYYPYKIEIEFASYELSRQMEQKNDIEKWCDENCKEEWYLYQDIISFFWFFKDEKDAIFFKLWFQ